MCPLWGFCKDSRWWNQSDWDIHFSSCSLETSILTLCALVYLCAGGTQTFWAPHASCSVSPGDLLMQPLIQWCWPWSTKSAFVQREKIYSDRTERGLAVVKVVHEISIILAECRFSVFFVHSQESIRWPWWITLLYGWQSQLDTFRSENFFGWSNVCDRPVLLANAKTMYCFQFLVPELFLVFVRSFWAYNIRTPTINQQRAHGYLRSIYSSSRISSCDPAAMQHARYKLGITVWCKRFLFEAWSIPGCFFLQREQCVNAMLTGGVCMRGMCIAYLYPRMAMCVENYFGETPDLQSQLDLAYESFKRFCKAEKIHCSQPPFKVRHVTRLLSLAKRFFLFTPGLFKEGISNGISRWVHEHQK